MRIKTTTFFFLSLLFLFAGFLGGKYLSFPVSGNDFDLGRNILPQDSSSQLNLDIFWRVFQELENNFYEPKQLDKKEMSYGAVKGLVGSLKDPYSAFFEPRETREFLSDIEGNFEGIGAELGVKDNQITVIAPLKNTPAERAGLESGDKIIEVDNKPTVNMSLDEAVSLIRGPKGSVVVLTVAREGESKLLKIPITRAVINIPVVQWHMIKGRGIAYIQIFSFTDNLPKEFKKIANQILKQGPRGIILDLRNNPGGVLESALKVGGYFIPKGKIIAVEKQRDGKEIKHASRGPSIFKDYKIVCLVNKGSASASEILAGALRDDMGVKLIGTVTFGKGTVQSFKTFPDGSSLKLTVAKWLTPKGLSINKTGIKPDYEIASSGGAAKEDNQLKKAIEILIH